MQCDYFDAGACLSCSLMGQPYPAQVADKQQRCIEALRTVAPGMTWLESVTGPESGFRNKAKLVVGGSIEQPTLGILDRDGLGIDLQGCGLYEAGLAATFAPLARFITTARIAPYDVPNRRGELKYLLLTIAPGGELMLRFVLRSQEAIARIRKHLPGLLAEVPELRVISANIHPEHKATLEGDLEIPLSDQQRLPIELDGVRLRLGGRSFFQTNTAIAAALYRQARQWAASIAPASVWDLYCGVGGFALHLLAPGRGVTGVEVVSDAVAAARASADDLIGSGASVQRPRFVAADATEWAEQQPSAPELVIVNPPRRGIGRRLAGWLESSGVRHVIYSSCNVESLARDLAAMPSLTAREARLFDMFPQTTHHEVMVLLQRH